MTKDLNQEQTGLRRVWGKLFIGKGGAASVRRDDDAELDANRLELLMNKMDDDLELARLAASPRRDAGRQAGCAGR